MSVDTNVHAELISELQAAAERALSGIRDPEAMRRASERMDRVSEGIWRRNGILDIAVPSIRELRDA